MSGKINIAWGSTIMFDILHYPGNGYGITIIHTIADYSVCADYLQSSFIFHSCLIYRLFC